ncbi:MAG: DUF3131 domain-containing protein [Gammaproteobacteria bacterium]|nr:DUF3131 domain-containing protein [Gammaproteobacteria bacterium]MBU1654481.1 DUF3131 domain-containing protein [Gammaproteobacteria bacterium]MBU1960133.1 DUF3131 domain-containing protein [Gammaproteobacteria bacterium]
MDTESTERRGSNDLPLFRENPSSLTQLLSGLLVAVLGVIIAVSVIFWPNWLAKEPLSAPAAVGAGQQLVQFAENSSCRVYSLPRPQCLGTGKPLCEPDIEIAKIAWKYYENNYQPATGLVNAADKYPSTTMWDTGSALAATIAARELGIIGQKEFDDRVSAMLATLSNIQLFEGEAPNKVYNTLTGEMADYKNNPSPKGIGVSTLDLARIASWLNLLSCFHPKHQMAAEAVLLRWTYCRLIKDGQMNGLMVDPTTKETKVVQEGRLGYEQYAGKIFSMFGFDQSVAASYKNQFATSIDIYDIPIAYDVRDPRKLGAYNYVVTESYAMDAMENGWDEENKPLIENILKVQKERWKRTGQVTAVSEDNVDRKPYFVYNTIFAAGSPWNAITDTGQDVERLKSISTKAAISLAILYPEDEYSAVLFDAVSSAYDPERGWYSGVYEKGLGYNKALTANTNGVVLGGLLYKMYGPLNRICQKCKLGITLGEEVLALPQNSKKCLPGQAKCGTCVLK